MPQRNLSHEHIFVNIMYMHIYHKQCGAVDNTNRFFLNIAIATPYLACNDGVELVLLFHPRVHFASATGMLYVIPQCFSKLTMHAICKYLCSMQLQKA